MTKIAIPSGFIAGQADSPPNFPRISPRIHPEIPPFIGPRTAPNRMLELYTWSTPNGMKISIMLEEIALPYTVHAVDILRDAQFEADFLRLSPNNKIPAIVDHDTGITMMESGAILLYLAEKSGRFMPTEPALRWSVMEWLMFQMGGLGPMLGQAHHFLKFNPGVSDYAARRYGSEAQRLYGVLERRLDGRDYLAGAHVGEYSIADIAAWPWIARHRWQGMDLAAYPNVRRWYVALAERPAVQRGYAIPDATQEIPRPD